MIRLCIHRYDTGIRQCARKYSKSSIIFDNQKKMKQVKYVMEVFKNAKVRR